MIGKAAIILTGAALVCLNGRLAAAEPLPADRLPPRLLADCDARAAPPARYEAPIAAAARALIDIGAFTGTEFQSARIGFCDLQQAGGPVAAATCDDAVILLDTKYAADDQALTLRATLAHEMTHHLQHRDAKARFGESYCASARYREDRPSLEAEADVFGDKIAELFLLGRSVEIVNVCGAPVAVYLEAHDPVALRGAAPAFQRVPAGASALSPERALSGRMRLYARTAPLTGPAHVWQDKTSAQSRIVEGGLVRLREIRLAPADRLESPFRLRLSCRNDSG